MSFFVCVFFLAVQQQLLLLSNTLISWKERVENPLGMCWWNLNQSVIFYHGSPLTTHAFDLHVPPGVSLPGL